MKLKHNVESMNEKGRWLESIGETPTHYLVLLRNAASGITSHVHAVLKSEYSVDYSGEKVVKKEQKIDNPEDFI
jgi:hypothetical protein